MWSLTFAEQKKVPGQQGGFPFTSLTGWMNDKHFLGKL
jgi:hypothetical protein